MSRRTLMILLFVSLALNLFVIGAVAGAGLFGAHLAREHHRMMRGGPMMAAAQALPDAERDAFRATLRSETATAGAKLRESRQLRRAAWLRLGADPLDAAAVSGDLDRARALEMDARAEIDRKLLDFAARLPADQRARFGQALAPPPRRGPAEPGPPPPP